MTNKFNKILFILLLYTGVVHTIGAQCVEEQNTQNATSYGGDEVGQSFIPDCSGNIVSISMVTHPSTVSGATARLDIKNANCDTIWTVSEVTLTSGVEVTFDVTLGSGISRFISLNDTYSFHLSNFSDFGSFRANSVSPYFDGCRMTNACSCISSADFQFSVEIEEVILPIELTNFKLVTQDKFIQLNWQTASEENTQNYTLERSADGGRTFQSIGTVAARNNPSGADYQYIDETVTSLGGQHIYYRLRAQDFDGTSQLFGPVVVELPSSAAGDLKIFPNPIASGQFVNIQGAAAGAKLELRAMDGRLLATLVPNPGGGYTLPAIQAGVYMIRNPDAGTGASIGKLVVR